MESAWTLLQKEALSLLHWTVNIHIFAMGGFTMLIFQGNLLHNHPWKDSLEQRGHYLCLQKWQRLGKFRRWRRNRMGRPLSPSQIPQKNISTLSKLHKTTSVGWQRTSGNQKSRPLSSKTGRKKYKRQKRRQRRWGGSSIPGREF